MESFFFAFPPHSAPFRLRTIAFCLAFKDHGRQLFTIVYSDMVSTIKPKPSQQNTALQRGLVRLPALDCSVEILVECGQDESQGFIPPLD
jgi:hypothetical protein